MLGGSSYHFSELALIACLALLANALLGGPASFYAPLRPLHPLALWEWLVDLAERKFNRRKRDAATRRHRGMMLIPCAVLLSFLLGAMLQESFRLPFGEYAELALLAAFLSARQTLDATVQIARLLARSPAEVDGKLLPATLVRREHASYDHPTLWRAAIELLAVRLSEGVVAPLLYYLLFGWPGLLLVSLVTVTDRQIGYQNAEARDFGRAAALSHSLLQWLPARLTALLIALAAWFAPGCSPLKAWRIMFAFAGKTRSANAGWSLSAMAGALHLTLGGPRSLHGSYIADGWIGEGTLKPQKADLRRAQALYAVVLLLLWLALLLGAAGIPAVLP